MRDAITLIANSGLQFYSFETKIDTSLQKSNKFRYIERFDSRRRRFWLDEAIAIPGDDDLFARKSELEQLGYLSPGGKLSDEIDTGRLELLDETELFEVGNLNQVFRYFEKKWIPIPFFKKNNINHHTFGPTDWVRLYFERQQDDVLKMVLLVDTSAAEDPADTVSPYVHENPNENMYSVCSDDNLVLSYMDALSNCAWVEDYISGLFNAKHAEIEQPYLKHIANYIFFNRVLRAIGKIPQIHLLSDKTGSIDVDLVIDVGNSNTCAILFENPGGQGFNFNAVKKLHVQDFSNPLQTHQDSFSTRLVFKEAGFGAFNTELNQNNKFQWPSPVRIGFEAERIINDAKVELQLNREVKSHNSSPKRYLWDSKPTPIEWEYHSDDMSVPPRRVYKKGISEQLKSDGSICEDNVFGSRSVFSRQSLMTFVYLEIFSQALRQINATEFRADHGNPSKKRKLKRIVISCPTAMIRKEQIALRECAVQAMKIINRYYKYVFNTEESAGTDVYDHEVEVVPSVRDLRYDLYNLDKRKDWIYDEATAPQLVFMYGMIKHKFDGNADLFFNLFGKPGTSLGKSEANRSLTIGSLDIGGGTSDLMICRYDYQYNEITELTPEPLFWESFNLAGDDMLKEIIQQIIIEGKIENENDRGCSGVIENHARELGIPDVAKKLNGFFGKDSNNIGYKGKLMRTNFLNQIALPIAMKYMEHANQSDVAEMDYAQLFPQQKPNADLLNYFEAHFGFRFETIRWRISSYKLNGIIQSVFSKLIRQIANIMNRFSCDVVILSGRPCSFQALEKLFLKYHPVSPNRLINLNHYWIGRWYPFSDNNGFVQDPKTVVSVGSLISLLGGSLYKLDKFRINTQHLRSKLISTADFIGNIKNSTIQESVLSPDSEEGRITVHGLPFQLGFKNIDAPSYPARNMYAIQFNDDRIAEALSRKGPMDAGRMSDQIEAFKHKIRMKMPLTFTLAREMEKDKEEVSIAEVADLEMNDLSKSYFELSIQTLPDQTGYWLDSGEFTLNIRN
jgi:hypothetical protein